MQSLHLNTWVNKSLTAQYQTWQISSDGGLLAHQLMPLPYPPGFTVKVSRKAHCSPSWWPLHYSVSTWNHFQFIYYAIDSPCVVLSFGLMYHCFVFLLDMWWFWFIYYICCAILIFILFGWLNKFATLRTLEVIVKNTVPVFDPASSQLCYTWTF